MSLLVGRAMEQPRCLEAMFECVAHVQLRACACPVRVTLLAMLLRWSS